MKTFKAILSFCTLLLVTNYGFSQGHNGLYGNEWIDYTAGKQYYKIKIHEDGMYRVQSIILQQAGANLSAINLNGLQVFHQGKEIPIRIETVNGQLSYVQFYGKKNRGAYDANLYNDINHHFNDRHSLYHDTSAYFLTWSNTASTQHITTVGANLSGYTGTNEEPYFMHKNSIVNTSVWNKGQTWQIATEKLSKSTFEYGEGFGGDLLANQSNTIPTEHAYTNGLNTVVDVQLYTPGNSNHILNIGLDGNLATPINFSGAKVGAYATSFSSSNLQPTTDISVSGSAANNDDKYRVAYIDVTYPRTFDFDASAIFPFKIQANSASIYLKMDNIDNTNSNVNQFYLYDLTNYKRIHCLYNGANVDAVSDLDPSSVDRELVFINEGNSNSYQNVTSVKAVTFRNFSATNFTSTNYVIISHSSLETSNNGGNPIADYRNYRQSLAGGGFDVENIKIQELYDQFSYGIDNHPLAVRHFGHYIDQVWTNPEYVFLIGKGRDYVSTRGVASNMLVPTFGQPASDQLMMGSINSDEPVIAVGRLSVNTGEEVSTYLQKIQVVEAERVVAAALPNKGWTRNVLHLGGGHNISSQNIIENNLDVLKTNIEAPSYLGAVSSFLVTNNPILLTQTIAIDSIVNNGVSMVTFYGAQNSTFNLGTASAYSNYQKYPLFLDLSCYNGNIYQQNPTQSEEFVLEPQAAAAVYLGCSDAAALSALNQYTTQFYNGLGTTAYGEGAAKSVKHAIHVMEGAGINYTITNQMVCHYMAYHGDPAFRLADTAALALPVRQIEKSTAELLKTFPNPAVQNLNIILSSQESSVATLVVTDMLGRTLLAETRDIHEGNNSLNLSTQDLPTGIYVLQVKLPQQEAMVKQLIVKKN